MGQATPYISHHETSFEPHGLIERSAVRWCGIVCGETSSQAIYGGAAPNSQLPIPPRLGSFQRLPNFTLLMRCCHPPCCELPSS